MNQGPAHYWQSSSHSKHLRQWNSVKEVDCNQRCNSSVFDMVRDCVFFREKSESGTYNECRTSFCLSLILKVTGRTHPRNEDIWKTGASASGGDGISRTVFHRSCPLESAKQCRAATAACRDVNVTTAYEESRTKSSTSSGGFKAEHRYSTAPLMYLCVVLLVDASVGTAQVPLEIIRSPVA